MVTNKGPALSTLALRLARTKTSAERCQKSPSHLGYGATVHVDRAVKAAHRRGINFRRKTAERFTYSRPCFEDGSPNDRSRFVRRKEPLVIHELHEIELLDQAVGGVAGDEIDLAIGERAIGECELHR